MSNPPFLGDVDIKKWSWFFCSGILSVIFWHLKTGTFGIHCADSFACLMSETSGAFDSYMQTKSHYLVFDIIMTVV